MTKNKYIPCLLQLFQQYGYDGATISKISQATGLGKASLYHHFPGGKEEMVTAVLDDLEQWLGQHILSTLQSEGDALTRLQRMGEAIGQLYGGGEKPCLFAILLLGSARDSFHERVKRLLNIWIDEMAKVLIEEGINASLARERAEDAALAVQGALILVQGLDDTTPFRRVIEQLPQKLCTSLR